VILSKNLKIAMRHVIFDWQKIYNTVIEKALLFFVAFLSFFGSCVEKFEKWPF
jgi:hypothetical protein